MLNKFTKKLHNNKGMTIGEVLIATLLLLLASAMLAGGIAFASRNYSKSVTKSDAQILMSSLREAINGELRYAENVYLDEDGKFIGYFSQNFGDVKGSAETGAFLVVDENGKEATNGYITAAGNHLISKTAYAKGLKAGISVNYEPKSSGKYIGCFKVTINIVNGKGESITANSFDIIPLIENELSTETE